MFAVVGLIGTVLLVLFLVFDDVFDGIFPDADWISGPVLGAFLAAFGLFGWVAEEGFDAPNGVAVGIGIAGGVGLGWFAARLAKALMHQPTDATPTTQSLIGTEGKVVTAISDGRPGEVLLQLAGQPYKISATADDTLAVGTEVVVVDVASATRVIVQSATRFWELDPSTADG
ncbi:MAG: NfeD family protein [Desertimonas sp.]